MFLIQSLGTVRMHGLLRCGDRRKRILKRRQDVQERGGTAVRRTGLGERPFARLRQSPGENFLAHRSSLAVRSSSLAVCERITENPFARQFFKTESWEIYREFNP